MKRELISKLQDLLDEYEDNAWNRREYKIISLRRKIEELLEEEIGEEGEKNEMDICEERITGRG